MRGETGRFLFECTSPRFPIANNITNHRLPPHHNSKKTPIDRTLNILYSLLAEVGRVYLTPCFSPGR